MSFGQANKDASLLRLQNISGVQKIAHAPNTAIVFGNSFSARNYNSALAYRLMDWGFFNWINWSLDSRFKLISNAGISGQKTSEMLARISDVTSLKPGCVFFEGGINDLTNAVDKADVISNSKEIIKNLTGSGSRVVYPSIFPNSSQAGVGQKILYVNRTMLEWAQLQESVLCLDIYSRTVNPTSTVGAIATGMSADALHASQKAARMYGKIALLSNLPSWFPAYDFLPSSALDDWSVDNTARQILTNPMLTGTSGVISGAGASGALATGWNGGTDTGTVTSVFTAGIARADGIGFNQRIAMIGASAGAVVNVRQTGLQARAAIGDTLFPAVELTMTGASDVAYIYVTMDVTIDGVATVTRIMDPSSTTYDQSDMGPFKFRGGDYLLAGANITNITYFIKIGFGTSGAGAATVEFGRPGLIK